MKVPMLETALLLFTFLTARAMLVPTSQLSKNPLNPPAVPHTGLAAIGDVELELSRD